MDWLENQRRRRSGKPPAKVQEWVNVTPPARQTSGGQSAAPKTKEEVAEVINQYFQTDGQIPKAEQVPGIPWLRRVPGVRKYARPKAVPQVLYRKYQSFKDAWDLVQEGGGEFVETDAGTAYQINWIQDSSYLFTRIGLRPGDRVISVNGQPVGQSVGAGKAMYDNLRGEKRFAVLIERKGQKLVLSYFVQ